jgi:hypothetical protein
MLKFLGEALMGVTMAAVVGILVVQMHGWVAGTLAGALVGATGWLVTNTYNAETARRSAARRIRLDRKYIA